MMCKKYMLIVFEQGECYRSMSNTSPLQRVLELYRRNKNITDVEIYKYIITMKDYKYLCTIKFDRGLLHV